MNSMRSYLNLRFLPSTASGIARARKYQTSLILAVALCAAGFVAAPAYGASSKATADSTPSHQNIHYGTIVPDAQSAEEGVSHVDSDVSGVHSNLTLVYEKVRPGVRYELTNLVLYNDKCEEITPGGWYLTSAPKYGVASEGYTYGKLANGDCPGVRFESRAIYYTWTHDQYATKDEFKAYWAGDGYKTNTITFAFDLDY
ncbi:MAG: hypothetical protein ABSF53_17170 [Terracidiphilus sp.]|jgi:hypothetical protein